MGYTPTTEQILDAYMLGCIKAAENHGLELDMEEAKSMFYRWIAKERRAIADELNGLMDSLDDSITHEQIYEALNRLWKQVSVNG